MDYLVVDLLDVLDFVVVDPEVYYFDVLDFVVFVDLDLFDVVDFFFFVVDFFFFFSASRLLS